MSDSTLGLGKMPIWLLQLSPLRGADTLTHNICNFWRSQSSYGTVSQSALLVIHIRVGLDYQVSTVHGVDI
jgi:hypothetical protein